MFKKISIAIPNFNGRNLLEKNLPNILHSGADEVMVVDDGSTDGSLELLSKFKVQSEKFKILEHKQNRGFIISINELFQEANGDIVVLLNSDVSVERDFLKSLVGHFSNEKVFAVNCHEEGEGPAKAFWQDGFFEFKRGQGKEELQKSSWASGGSAAYSKKIWTEIGGFDEIFAPFYWEDVDLSFRAIKKGYEVLWEPRSRVRHQHEATIKRSFSKKYIAWVQQRNQLLFIWKNITDRKLKREHKINLTKRLLGGMGIGYWIPFIWALLRWKRLPRPFGARNDGGESKRSDLEVINYAAHS